MEPIGLTDVITSGISAGLASAGTIGGVFWWLLRRSLDRTDTALKYASRARIEVEAVKAARPVSRATCDIHRENAAANDQRILDQLDTLGGKVEELTKVQVRLETLLNGERAI